MKRRILSVFLGVALVALAGHIKALAQGLGFSLMSGHSTALANVLGLPIRSGSLQVAFSPTYTYPNPPPFEMICGTASTAVRATTAAYILSLDAPTEGQAITSPLYELGLTVSRICVGTSVATANAAQTVTVQRRLSRSSGGTALVHEGTGTDIIHFNGGFDFPDVVGRVGGTPGTAGPIIDQWSWTTGELGAGAADPRGQQFSCRTYGAGRLSLDRPIVLQGSSTGLTVNVSAAGAGGLASGAISIDFCRYSGQVP